MEYLNPDSSSTNSLLDKAEVNLAEKKEEIGKSVLKNTIFEEKKESKKRKRKRCEYEVCNKRLKVVELELECKCGKSYCKVHRYPEDHECSYNFKEMGKRDIEKMNEKIIGNKIEYI